MNPLRKVEMQCTPAEFFRELRFACWNLPYEIIGERVIVHDHGRKVQITIRDEPIRHPGSLNLPMEEITLRFADYTEQEADRFVSEFLRRVLRTGG